MAEPAKKLKEWLKNVAEPRKIVIVAKPKRVGIESQRGSKYRGVSKNGKKWQVSINANKDLSLLTIFVYIRYKR